MAKARIQRGGKANILVDEELMVGQMFALPIKAVIPEEDPEGSISATAAGELLIRSSGDHKVLPVDDTKVSDYSTWSSKKIQAFITEALASITK
jgi:hypothetical protein